MERENRTSRLFKMLQQVAPNGEIECVTEELQASIEHSETGEVFDSIGSDAEDLEFAREALDSIVRSNGRESLDEEQQESLEAIIHKRYRPALYVESDSFKRPSAPWTHLGERVDVRKRIESVIPFIGRIEVANDPKGRPYVGTGVVVGPDILLTNRHVAESFIYGVGTRELVFKPGLAADVDFLQEQGSPKSRRVRVSPRRVLMVHPWWDLAILSVDGLNDHAVYSRPLDEYPRLMANQEIEEAGNEVVVIGYPALDERNDVELQRRIFQVFNVKRMQPGKLGSRRSYQSYGKAVSAITHDCSTLGGNSGSAVVDIKTGAIVGIHFAGEYLDANFAVPATELAKESRIVDCGVRFTSRENPSPSCDKAIKAAWNEIEQDGGGRAGMNAGANVQAVKADDQGAQSIRLDCSSRSLPAFSIPLTLSVSIGAPVLSPTIPAEEIKTAVSLQEGRFSISPPAISTAPFNLESLSTASFTWKAALTLALASKLAYESDQSVRSTCLGSARSWGFGSCEIIDVDDTQCFVALTPEIALVSFRGTESRGDWLRNVNVPGRTREYGVAHRGFLGAFQAVESRLRSALSGIARRKLILTGHSLGGALATVMAAEWQDFMPASWIVTFGQPAVGSGSFRMFFLQHYSGKFFRFVNDDDIVPRVPPGYEHVGRLLHFDAQGRLQNGQSLPLTEQGLVESMQNEAFEPGPPMLTEAEYQALQAQIGQDVVSVDRVLTESHTQTPAEGLIPSVSDHSLDKYIAKIAAKARP